jgi:short-subunit dehydrogenase
MAVANRYRFAHDVKVAIIRRMSRFTRFICMLLDDAARSSLVDSITVCLAARARAKNPRVIASPYVYWHSNNGDSQMFAGHVVADVGKHEDVCEIARVAQEAFGGFDTWINNAGTSIYGKLEDVPVADMRRLFETNFWGLIYGSLEAVKHLKPKGGALINLGSTVSDRAIPLQGMYSATKHAIKGFTDALRMELEQAGAPVSVTLVKPGAIDTPFPHNAKNYLETEPQQPSPVYAPETVARTILHCAETPERDVFVGAGGKVIAALGHYAPHLTDKLMEGTFIRATKSQQSDKEPAPAAPA